MVSHQEANARRLASALAALARGATLSGPADTTATPGIVPGVDSGPVGYSRRRRIMVRRYERLYHVTTDHAPKRLAAPDGTTRYGKAHRAPGFQGPGALAIGPYRMAGFGSKH